VPLTHDRANVLELAITRVLEAHRVLVGPAVAEAERRGVGHQVVGDRVEVRVAHRELAALARVEVEATEEAGRRGGVAVARVRTGLVPEVVADECADLLQVALEHAGDAATHGLATL